ncbi:hypothetical protein BN2475_700035 [Paraburkholderia ribeironis]|uniref:Uncharacterized protein n=1 Tax=Paraburkholderia ribeironis TaxID=1247936 RepID=A0A1N7SHM3_9BURK|nr:hypothetical protein BN2475_700035 [Paraburkholderia ribeironis]
MDRFSYRHRSPSEVERRDFLTAMCKQVAGVTTTDGHEPEEDAHRRALEPRFNPRHSAVHCLVVRSRGRRLLR